jgi:hypothetical protein
MAKNKKKDTKSYLVKPQGATATVKRSGNTKVDRAIKVAAGLGIAAIPVGRAATTVGKIVSAVTKPKLSSAGKAVKTKTVTQGPKARVTAKAPGKAGAAYSPIKGTKVKVDYETRKLSAQQEKNIQALTTSQKARRGLSTAKGAVAGAVATSKGDKSKKANKNKKK